MSVVHPRFSVVAFLIFVFAAGGCGGGEATDNGGTAACTGDACSPQPVQDLRSPEISSVVFLTDPSDSEPFPSALADCRLHAVQTDAGLVVTVWPARTADETLLRTLPPSRGAELIQQLSTGAESTTEEDANLFQAFAQTCESTLDVTREWCSAAWDWTSAKAAEIWAWIKQSFEAGLTVVKEAFAPVIASTALGSEAVSYLQAFLQQCGSSTESADSLGGYLALVGRVAGLVAEKATRDLWDLAKDAFHMVLHPVATLGAIVEAANTLGQFLSVAPSLTGSQWETLAEAGLDVAVQEFGNTSLTAWDLIAILTRADIADDQWREACATVVYSAVKLVACIVAASAGANFATNLFRRMKEVCGAAVQRTWEPVWAAPRLGVTAGELRRNLDNAGRPHLPGDEAHHIIPQRDSKCPSATELREMAEKYGLDLHSSDNGVWLPKLAATRTATDDRVAHLGEGLHTYRYYDYVRDKAIFEVKRAHLRGSDQSLAFKKAIRGVGEALEDRERWKAEFMLR